MQRPATVYVWDPFVRLFHWSLVTAVVLNQFVLEEGDTPHEWVGYAAALLVALRLLWGLIGTRHARFSDWWPTPSRLRAHAQGLLTGHPEESVGHNPLGALMMLTLMALVLALALTGWLQTVDAFEDAAEWAEELHEALANALLALAAIHALAAVIIGRWQRVTLVRAMVTGFKRFY
jgi:cytochrome b